MTTSKTYHGDRPCLPPEAYLHLWNANASDDTPLRLRSTCRMASVVIKKRPNDEPDIFHSNRLGFFRLTAFNNRKTDNEPQTTTPK